MRALNYLVIKKNNKLWTERPLKATQDGGLATFGEGVGSVCLPTGSEQKMTLFLVMVSTEQGVSGV